jgi:hypothetical protein
MIHKVRKFDTDELLLEFLEKNIGKIDVISTHNTPYNKHRSYGGSYSTSYNEINTVSVIYKLIPEVPEIKRKEI